MTDEIMNNDAAGTEEVKAPAKRNTGRPKVAKATLIHDTALVNVKSNFFGKLIFDSPRGGGRVEWDECGEVQTIPFSMLRTIKTENINFFKNQWISVVGFADENDDVFGPGDVYSQLYVGHYYAAAIDPSDEERICAMTPSEIRAIIPKMPDGAKENLIIALNEYIGRGDLDSVKSIKAFEEALNCALKEVK